MLAAKNRLTTHDDFVRTTKSPIKASTDSLIGYLLHDNKETEPRVGFIVSRNLGGAVTRHQITRRLRHATRSSLHFLPQQSLVVVRAKKSPNVEIEIPNLFNALNQKALIKSVKA